MQTSFDLTWRWYRTLWCSEYSSSAPGASAHACGLQAEVQASWTGRRQAALLGRQDEEKRAAEAAGRLQVARERAQERERLRVQQNAALQARYVICYPRFKESIY